MYYVTKRDSETGKKMAAMLERIQVANDLTLLIAKQHGAKSARQGYWCVAGGISCLLFDIPPDTSIWKQVEDGYMPKMNTKAGKSIGAKLKEAPRVFNQDLNEVVGYGSRWNHIGYNPSSDEYFAFSLQEKWQHQMPDDCEEITTSKYRELFRITDIPKED